MSYLDIILLVLLIGFGLLGLRKGLITEAATLLGLGLGLYGALHFSDFTARLLVDRVSVDPKYLNVISFAVTFLVVAILVFLLGKLVAKLVKAVKLGFIDKLGGFLIGLVKGLLVCSLVIMLLNALSSNGLVKEDLKQKSFLYPLVEKTVPYVYQGFNLVKQAVENATDTNEDTISYFSTLKQPLS